MFIDIAKIFVRSGDGGDGAVSFHREKYVAAGPPDGGDGAHGGNIVFVGDEHLNTLLDFKYTKKYVAEKGERGGRNNCAGRRGADKIIKVPIGTLIKDEESGTTIADITDDTPVTVVKGGRGGWGNARFKSSTRQGPQFARAGAKGRELNLVLELKLLADVGIVGYPSVGKSTLISVVSAAKPKIASYHFTTLTPTLGVVRKGEQTAVFADIPGLIEGASDGVGLGHDFLRHIERCRLIIHMVDVSEADGRNCIDDFNIINKELAGFSTDLSSRPQIVVMNKTDAAIEEQIEMFKEFCPNAIPISAAARTGIDEMLDEVFSALTDLPPIVRFKADYIEPAADEAKEFDIEIDEDGVFVVDAPWLETPLSFVNLEDLEGISYFQKVITSAGIMAALREKGVKTGDTVRILDFEFDWEE